MRSSGKLECWPGLDFLDLIILYNSNSVRPFLTFLFLPGTGQLLVRSDNAGQGWISLLVE